MISFTRDGSPARAPINATRETGANVLEVMDGIRAAFTEFNEGPLLREGLILRQVYDETEYINASIDLVRSNIVVVSVLIGASLLGVIGALLAIPVAGSIQVVLRRVLDGRRQRVAAERQLMLDLGGAQNDSAGTTT